MRIIKPINNAISRIVSLKFGAVISFSPAAIKIKNAAANRFFFKFSKSEAYRLCMKKKIRLISKIVLMIKHTVIIKNSNHPPNKLYD